MISNPVSTCREASLALPRNSVNLSARRTGFHSISPGADQVHFLAAKETKYTTVGNRKIPRASFEAATQAREQSWQSHKYPEGPAPKVSILIPVFNDGEFLAKTIESLRKQTLKDWEVLILNDGSIDNSLEVATALAKQDPRIVVISGPHTGQLAASKNWMVGKARGEFIAQMDGDDLYNDPETLAKEVDYLKAHPETQLVHTAGKRIETDGRPIPNPKYDEAVISPHAVNPKRKDTWENLLLHQSLAHYQASMVRKENWVPIPEVEVNSDKLWYVATAAKYGIENVKLLPIHGFLWRKNPGSITRSPERHLKMIETSVEGNQFIAECDGIPNQYKDPRFLSKASSIRYSNIISYLSDVRSKEWLIAKVLKCHSHISVRMQ